VSKAESPLTPLFQRVGFKGSIQFLGFCH